MRLWLEILIAVSLSNLLFIRSWRRLLYPTGEAYHAKLSPSSTDYLAIILNVLLAAFIFLACLWGARYFSGKTPLWAKIIFLLICGVALNGIRHQLSGTQFNFYLNLAILGLLGLIGVLVMIKFGTDVFEMIRYLLLFCSPLVLITFSQAGWGIIAAGPAAEKSLETRLSMIRPEAKPAVKNRVIWIIFDELDYSVPFEKRPVPLPEFERLKQISFFSTRAAPPAYTTRDATASLLTGKKVTDSDPISKGDLLLKFTDGEAKFSEAPNIFRHVKAFGGETAVVGWLHPYCRVLGQDLSVCQWHSVDTFQDFEPSSVGRTMRNQAQNLLFSLPFGARIDDLINEKLKESAEDQGYLKRHLEMMKASRAVISNPNIDLAFLHLPFPHPPNYYQAEKGDFISSPTRRKSRENSYFDNLILADRVLGELRRTLEEKNLWDNSTVIISSDHQWRINVYRNELSEKEAQITGGTEDARVPFFLKLKGQNESVIHEKPFNTVITHDLILALLTGEISTVDEVKKWLEKN